MSLLRTVAQALVVITFIWGLGLVFYPPRSDQNVILQEPDRATKEHIVPSALSKNDIGLCFIIRTYWAHGPAGGDAESPLDAMLNTLVRSGHQK